MSLFPIFLESIYVCPYLLMADTTINSRCAPARLAHYLLRFLQMALNASIVLSCLIPAPYTGFQIILSLV